MPAVVVGDVSHAGVGNFGLGGQERLRGGSHADNAHAPLAEALRFAAGAETRPFHGDERPAPVDATAGRLSSAGQRGTQGGTEGMRGGQVRDDAAAEEAGRADTFGKVKKLVGNNDFAGGEVLAQ